MLDDAAIIERLGLVAAELRARTAELTMDLVSRYGQDVPPLRDDEAMMSLLAASVYQNIESALRVVEHTIDMELVTAPVAALEYARRLAQRGVPVVELIRAYHIGQTAITEYAMVEAYRQINDAPMMGAVMQRIVAVAFAYIERVTAEVVSAYEEERDRWRLNRSAVRAARVRATLDAGAVDVAATEAALGYRLSDSHVGMVEWYAVDPRSSDALYELEKLAADIAKCIGCVGRPLFVPCDESTAWVWLPVSESVLPTRELLEQVIADSNTRVRLAVGKPGRGVEGFRRTHRQALRVQALGLVAGNNGDQVMSFGEVGAVALMASDLDSAKVYVADTLGALATDNAAHERLRETVRVFLATGGSYTAAATQLTIHKNSVQYRVRKAEDLLGHQIVDNRLDVELALALCRWLGSAVLPSP